MQARFSLHIWYKHIAKLSLELPDLYSMTRSFISPASFNIFNRLCDTLLLLVLSYAKYYPEHPFCPWLIGTEFIEHFFGLARSMLPNFTFAELLKMVKHTMLHQRLMLSGKFSAKRERSARAGYILDYDATPLSEEELLRAHVTLTTLDINRIIELAHKEAGAIAHDILHMPEPKLPLTLVPLSGPNTPKSNSKAKGKAKYTADNQDGDSDNKTETDWDGDEEDEDDSGSGHGFIDVEQEAGAAGAAALDAARFAQLCDDYDNDLALLSTPSERTLFIGPLPPPRVPEKPSAIVKSTSTSITITSEILDSSGKISIDKLLESRTKHQSSTATRSERTVQLDPKFTVPNNSEHKEDKDPKTRIKELAHRVRVAQDLDSGLVKTKTDRQNRWLTAAKDLGRIIPEKGNAFKS